MKSFAENLVNQEAYKESLFNKLRSAIHEAGGNDQHLMCLVTGEADWEIKLMAELVVRHNSHLVPDEAKKY